MRHAERALTNHDVKKVLKETLRLVTTAQIIKKEKEKEKIRENCINK